MILDGYTITLAYAPIDLNFKRIERRFCVPVEVSLQRQLSGRQMTFKMNNLVRYIRFREVIEVFGGVAIDENL